MEWITDRLPTEADPDEDGDVIVQAEQRDEPPDGVYFDWQLVRDGMAWLPGKWWEAPVAEPDPEPEPAPAPKPALAVGQRWRRRDGEVVTITEHDTKNDTYPFCASCHWYHADGTSCIDDSNADLVELIEPAAEPEPVTTPRRFVSIGRTVWMDQHHTIDAVADDGTAWWMVPGETEWQQLPALPAREVPRFS